MMQTGNHESSCCWNPNLCPEKGPHLGKCFPFPTLRFLNCPTNLHVLGWLWDFPLAPCSSPASTQSKKKSSVSTTSRDNWTQHLPFSAAAYFNYCLEKRSEDMGRHFTRGPCFTAIILTFNYMQLYWGGRPGTMEESPGRFIDSCADGQQTSNGWRFQASGPLDTATETRGDQQPRPLLNPSCPSSEWWPLCSLHLQIQPVAWYAHILSCFNPRYFFLCCAWNNLLLLQLKK